jgi:hypothetical protein
MGIVPVSKSILIGEEMGCCLDPFVIHEGLDNLEN